jgi:cytoskeletal protein CcmA (bactofilin family)
MFSKGSSSKRPSSEQQPSTAPEKALESKKPASASRGVPSILSKDLKIFGNLESEGELQVDGLVEGQISGNLSGELVRVAGKISGSIDASKVELDDSAKVLGDIRHDLLSIASGAYVVGKVLRRDSKQPQSEPARPAQSEPARPATTAPQAAVSPAGTTPPTSGTQPGTAGTPGGSGSAGGSAGTPGTPGTTPGGPATTPGKPV